MKRAARVIRRNDVGKRIAVDSITLDRQSRHRRRVAMTSDRGHEFLLDLAEATYLAGGDVLEMSDGALVKVVAAAEDLLEIHAHSGLELARIAWHLGNRHTPAELTHNAIYIQPDHVLAAMVEGLGAHVHAVKRPFEPEGGAYGGHGALESGHHHGDAAPGHQHGHGHDHHEHRPGHHHPHSHGHHHPGHSETAAVTPRKPAIWKPE